jgi:undecaprenyl-diphosphatase
MKQIQEIDIWILIHIQKLSNDFLDIVMISLSDFKSWIPISLFVIYKSFKENATKKAFLILVIIVAGISLADYLCSSIMKPYFKRLRPCLEPGLIGIVRIVDQCGGKYSFVSSHASTSFALCFGAILNLKLHKYAKFSFILWAALVSISRIYLGVHYFTDIFVGACIGMAFAYVLFIISKKTKTNLL